MNNRFPGRDPATVAADLEAIREELAEAFDEATALWSHLDRIARNEQASTFTRSRAQRAAVALGSLLDDLAADDAEQAFTWNDPPDADDADDR